MIDEFFKKGDLCFLKYEIQFTDVEERNQKYFGEYHLQ